MSIKCFFIVLFKFIYLSIALYKVILFFIFFMGALTEKIYKMNFKLLFKILKQL